MEILCICGIYEWLGNRENLKDFIIPSLTIAGTIWAAFAVAKMQNRNLKENEIKEETENNQKTIQLIQFINSGIINDLEKISSQLKNDKDNFELNLFKNQNYPILRKTHINAIDSLGFKVIFQSLSSRGVSEVILNNYLNSTMSLKESIQSIEKYYYYVNEEYNKQNKIFNEILETITIWMSDTMHKNIEPFTDTQLDLDIPEEALSYEVALIHQWYVDQKFSDDNTEENGELLNMLDKLRFHPVASKALDSIITNKVLVAKHQRNQKLALFDTAKESFDNFIALIKKYIVHIDNLNTEIVSK